jgi:hypothetical protein
MDGKILISDEAVTVKRGVFTIKVEPTDERDIEGCIERAYEILAQAGASNYDITDERKKK